MVVGPHASCVARGMWCTEAVAVGPCGAVGGSLGIAARVLWLGRGVTSGTKWEARPGEQAGQPNQTPRQSKATTPAPTPALDH